MRVHLHARRLARLRLVVPCAAGLGGRAACRRIENRDELRLARADCFIVELAQLAGINTLRATDWLDGADDWRNSAVWTNLDYLLAKTAQQRMFVIIDLSAFRKWLIKN